MKNGKNNNFNKKDGSKFYLMVFVALFIALGARVLFLGGFKTENGIAGETVKAPIELSFSDVLRRADDIKTMEIGRNDVATGKLKDGTPYHATITYNPELLEKISKNGATVSINNHDSFFDVVARWVPLLVGLLFLFWFLRLMRGGNNGGGITRSLIGQNPTKITTGKTKTTFNDVAGIDSEKQELMEVVEFLKNKENLMCRILFKNVL